MPIPFWEYNIFKQNGITRSLLRAVETGYGGWGFYVVACKFYETFVWVKRPGKHHECQFSARFKHYVAVSCLSCVSMTTLSNMRDFSTLCQNLQVHRKLSSAWWAIFNARRFNKGLFIKSYAVTFLLQIMHKTCCFCNSHFAKTARLCKDDGYLHASLGRKFRWTCNTMTNAPLNP